MALWSEAGTSRSRTLITKRDVLHGLKSERVSQSLTLEARSPEMTHMFHVIKCELIKADRPLSVLSDWKDVS